MTKDSQVYHHLRAGILRHDFAPGQHLVEEELCRQFNITRTPLRLALRRLEHERLVVAEPFRGCRVREVSHDEIESLFDLREVLEGLAARLVAGRADAAGLAHLRELARRCDEAQRDEQWTLYFEQDKIFHRELIVQAGNAELAEVMEVYDFQLRTFSLHHRYLLHVVKQMTLRGHETTRNHEKLVDTLESGDTELSESRLRAHVRGSKEVVAQAVHDWAQAQLVPQAGPGSPKGATSR